jgi:GNAT superfamily N-acetyltransferase
MSNQSIEIRAAQKADCARMLELVQELATFEKAPDEVSVTLAHFEESGFGENPVWWGFVAVENDIIVGMAIYYIRYSTWKGQTMYLEDLLVTESHRQKGIGQLLLNALKEEAKKKNFPFIRWEVLEWNAPAIAFYKKNQADLDPEWINCTLKVN